MTPIITLAGQHEQLAAQACADLINLDLLGRWPQGERAYWVTWSLDHGASLEVIARVLGVTCERVRQINYQEKRQRRECGCIYCQSGSARCPWNHQWDGVSVAG